MRPKLEDLTTAAQSQPADAEPGGWVCPQCSTTTQRWQQHRICRDCGISWSDPRRPGLREAPTGDTGIETAPPLLGGDDQ